MPASFARTACEGNPFARIRCHFDQPLHLLCERWAERNIFEHLGALVQGGEGSAHATVVVTSIDSRPYRNSRAHCGLVRGANPSNRKVAQNDLLRCSLSSSLL